MFTCRLLCRRRWLVSDSDNVLRLFFLRLLPRSPGALRLWSLWFCLPLLLGGEHKTDLKLEIHGLLSPLKMFQITHYYSSRPRLVNCNLLLNCDWLIPRNNRARPERDHFIGWSRSGDFYRIAYFAISPMTKNQNSVSVKKMAAIYKTKIILIPRTFIMEYHDIYCNTRETMSSKM